MSLKGSARTNLGQKILKLTPLARSGFDISLNKRIFNALSEFDLNWCLFAQAEEVRNGTYKEKCLILSTFLLLIRSLTLVYTK